MLLNVTYEYVFVFTAQTFGKDDVIGCLVDLDAKTIRFSKNGTQFPKAFDVQPDVLRSGLCAAVCLKVHAIPVNQEAISHTF